MILYKETAKLRFFFVVLSGLEPELPARTERILEFQIS